jgi:hypothetical protein
MNQSAEATKPRMLSKSANPLHAASGSNVCWSDVANLVVTEHGSVAWTETGRIATTTGTTSTIVVVRRAEVSAPASTLDKSAAINPQSLRLSGHTVSWEDGGQLKTAVLP